MTRLEDSWKESMAMTTMVAELTFFDMLQNGNWGKDFIRDMQFRWAEERVERTRRQPAVSLVAVETPRAEQALATITGELAAIPDEGPSGYDYEYETRRSYLWARIKHRFTHRSKRNNVA
jgi:hypothetical protein